MRCAHPAAVLFLSLAGYSEALGQARYLADTVEAAEQRLQDRAGLSPTELRAMHYAVEHYLALGGEIDPLVAAATAATNHRCRDRCLIFVVEALTMTNRAEIAPDMAQGMIDQALAAMAHRRDNAARRWTDLEQGAWTWVEVDAQVRRALSEQDDRTRR